MTPSGVSPQTPMRIGFRRLRAATRGAAFGLCDLLKKVDQNFYTGSAESRLFGLRFRREYSRRKSGQIFLRRKNLRRRNLHKLYGCICHGVQGAASPAGAPGQSPAVSPHVLTKGGTLPPLLIIIDDSRETAGIPPRGGTLTESARQARDGGRLCSHLLYTAINIL